MVAVQTFTFVLQGAYGATEARYVTFFEQMEEPMVIDPANIFPQRHHTLEGDFIEIGNSPIYRW